MRPLRELRASFDDRSVVVYQAFASGIAIPAAARNSLGGTDFKINRMTWVKPSFLWMMYRSGWASKPDQEHVLAVRISRTGFESALAQSALSHYDPSVYPNRTSWEERKNAAPVRVQWDPERDLALNPLRQRSLQIGLGPPVVEAYLNDWIIDVDDVTQLVGEIRDLAASGKIDRATSALPQDAPYPLPQSISRLIGATYE